MKLGPGLTLVRFLACYSNQDVLFYSLCNSAHLYDFPYTEWMGIVVVVVSLYFLNDMVYFYYENQPYNIHYYSNSFNQATCVRVTCRIEMKIRPICNWYWWGDVLAMSWLRVAHTNTGFIQGNNKQEQKTTHESWITDVTVLISWQF